MQGITYIVHSSEMYSVSVMMFEVAGHAVAA